MALKPIHIIGGGLAGSEAAWQAAQLGVPVILHEMRPERKTDAHQTDGMAELVCSNSFRSDDNEQNAVGLLHWEMRAANGLIMATAEKHRLPAGGALAVDRDPFAQSVTDALMAHPNISVEYGDSVSIGTAIAEVLDLSNLTIKSSIPQAQISQILINIFKSILIFIILAYHGLL